MSHQVWSIGLASSSNIMDLGNNISKLPILSAADILDVKAGFVADPFLIRNDDNWYLFFEVWNDDADKGEIALAVSKDLGEWRYCGIVLREPWHLSYPHVFSHGGSFWMTPEGLGAGAVRLYQATDFPYRWRYHCDLLPVPLADPTPFFWQDHWYLLGCPNFNTHDALTLYTSTQPTHGWKEHPQSPIHLNDSRRSRPAGRVWLGSGMPIRWAQDCQPRYGTAVRAFEMNVLSPTHYHEKEIAQVLSPGTASWNVGGMHHIDPHVIKNGQAACWIAAVDGFRDSEAA
ncbi:hypothetical protein H4S14_000363 [Agrobacterium vitis]|nr:hypothetical protein [Agrobacterium vitis]MBE1436636.1 hypothetical protein [Agrobacterium vitis]